MTVSGKTKSVKGVTTVTISKNCRSHMASVLMRQRGNTGTYAHGKRPFEDTAR